jgi:hypothetical protein
VSRRARPERANSGHTNRFFTNGVTYQQPKVGEDFIGPIERGSDEALDQEVEFLNWLATGYNNRGRISWDHENYETEALRHYKANDVVYLVWFDDTKPRNVDYILCKHLRRLDPRGQCLIPCRSKESAEQLWEVLRARAGWERSVWDFIFACFVPSP